MKKFFITLMCIIMVVCFMPTVAMAETGSGAAAKIGETEYDTLQAAVDVAVDGQTITLLKAVEGSITIPQGKKMILDLNGQVITDDGTTIKNNGNLTIKDTAGNGKVVSNTNVTVAAGDNSVTTIESGTFEAREGAVITGMSTGATINISGGTFNVSDNAVIAGNGTNREGDSNTINISGGTFNGGIVSDGYVACGIYSPWKDNITVTGGTFNITKGAGVVARAGNVNITGGTFNVCGNTAGKVGDSNVSVPCSAIVFDSSADYPAMGNESKILVTGGDFTSQVEPVKVIMPSGDSNKRISVSGGTFSSDVSDYIVEGNKMVNSDGKFVLAPADDALAKIGNVGYITLQAAIAAAEDGDTAKLLGDVTNAQGISIPSGKNFTLDFAGRTYTLTGPGAGSANTETNGFQLLKDSDITFKNGTIKIAENANKIKRIIQNYANLKLEDMKFYAKNQVGGENYPLSFNNGNIVFSGNTSIITSNDDTIAFDVYYWKEAYPNGTSVTFDNSYTGTINGKILYDSVDPEKAKLVINGNGSFGAVETSKDTKNGQSITITGGTFSTDPKEYVASGYTVDGSGPYTVKAVSSGIPSIPTTPTDNVTNSGSTAADNATTSADLSNTTSTSNGTTAATVDKTTADKIVDKAVENKSTEVVIDATANSTAAADSTTTAQVTIPTETLGAIAEKTEADVTIKTDVAEVKMDNAAAAAVSEQATGDTVQIVAEKVAEETDKVEFELKVVCSDGKVISDFKGGNIAVTVALPKAMAEKKVVCVYIDDNGHMSKVEGQKNADGTYTFFTGHFSTYAILAEEEADAVIAEQTEAIKNIEIKVSTKLDATKAGKKGIKVTWKTADGKKLDGVEFFRSVKKNSGYGKKAFFTSKKAGTTGYYLNTKSLKKGTRYYYRVRGYVLVDGQKVYTDWSNKGIRTFK